MPAWKPPTGSHQGACTEAQTTTFVDCLDNVSDVTCKAFFGAPANTRCISCALDPTGAATYGPLVEGTAGIDVNESGCIALTTGDASATGCGAKVLALRQCEESACESSCLVPTDDAGAPHAVFLACEKNADATVCKAFADGATCANALEADGGVASVCAGSGTTFAEHAKSIVNLFCGGILDDAGASDAAEGA